MTTYGNSDDRLSEEIELLRRRILEYEQLEDELRRTQVTCDTYERRMASILSTIPDQVILHDKDLKIIWVNRAAARYLGLDPGEVPRVDCFALLFDRTSPCRECAVVSVLETGKPSGVVTVRRGERYLDLQSIPILGPDGSIESVLEIGRDVTDRKHADKNIRESEERYRLLAENVQDVIWTMDPDLNFTYISPSVYKMRGVPQDEAISQRLADFIAPGSMETVIGLIDDIVAPARNGNIEPNYTLTFELELLRRDGSTVWTETSVTMILDEDGKLKSILGVSRNITERRIAAQVVEDGERRYRLLAENSADVIFVLDQDLEMEYVSPSIKRLSGYEADEFIDMEWMSLLTPSSKDHVMELMAQGIVDQMAGHDGDQLGPVFEVQFTRKDGSTRWAEATVSTLFDEGGDITRIIGAIRDIQERKGTQERYLEAKKNAEFYLEVFSHDVANICQGMIGYLEMTKSNLGLEGPDATFVNNTLMHSLRIIDLVRNLHLLTLLKDGDFYPEPTDPMDLLHAATAEVLGRYPNRDIKIDLDERGPPVLAEAHPMLKDVFRIMLDNAVENDRHTGAKVEVVKGLTDDGEAVMMEFRDHGKGIPDAMKKKVFERLDGEKWSVSGSGLSLAVVRAFVKGVGGSVWVEDRVSGDPGQGANFVLVLPLAVTDATG